MRSLRVVSYSPAQTQEMGLLLGREAREGDLFFLAGPLGVGKTCLAQGIAWGLGLQEYIRSSSFVLVAEYSARLPLYHIDLYRIEDAREIQELGLEEYFLGPGVCIVEWADKVAPLFPLAHLWVQMEPLGEERRSLYLEARGERYEALLKSLGRKGS